jgi:CPA1 family monovalent cation:H+ antiporter
VFGEIALAIGLLLVAYLFAQVASHAGLPPAAAIVLVGIAAGGMLPPTLQYSLTPGLLALFLPALIFEGAWDIDAPALRRVALAIAVLAVPGVLLTAAGIAAAGTLAGMALVAALALGAILSATDPIAVLALFRSLSVPVDLLTIVEGESIANDGVAVVLVQAVMTFAATAGAPPLWRDLGEIAYVSVAGVAAGIAFAGLGTPLLRRWRTPWVGIATTLAVAYGSYFAAAAIGASGIFASAAAGIALPAFALERGERRAIERFWDGTALVANGFVCLLVGLSLKLERIVHEPLLLFATLAAAVLTRGLLAYVLVAPAVRSVEGRGWRHAIALAGVRGGLSLALALGLPYEFPMRAQIIDAVVAVVFTTFVVQGWALAPLLRRALPRVRAL